MPTSQQTVRPEISPIKYPLAIIQAVAQAQAHPFWSDCPAIMGGVVSAIIFRLDQHNPTKRIFLNQTSLAGKLETSRPTIQKSLKWLIDNGFINIDVQGITPAGQWSCTTLFVTDKFLKAVIFQQLEPCKASWHNVLKASEEQLKESPPVAGVPISDVLAAEKTEKQDTSAPASYIERDPDLKALNDLGLPEEKIWFLMGQAKARRHRLSTVVRAVWEYIKDLKGKASRIVGYILGCFKKPQNFDYTLLHQERRAAKKAKKAAKEKAEAEAKAAKKAAWEDAEAKVKARTEAERLARDEAHDQAQKQVEHWAETRQRLAETLGGEYNTWLRPLSGRHEGGRLILTAPNSFFINQLRVRIGVALEATLGEIAPGLEYCFEVVAGSIARP